VRQVRNGLIQRTTTRKNDHEPVGELQQGHRPLLDYYRDTGKIRSVMASGEIDAIYAGIVKILRRDDSRKVASGDRAMRLAGAIVGRFFEEVTP